jgi:hypothetical protein
MNRHAARNPHTRWGAGRRAAGMLGVVTLVLSLGLHLLQPTVAAWTSPEFHNATINTGQVNPVTSLTCDAPAGLIGVAIGFTWTQPVTTGNGLVPTSYTLVWSGTAGSGQKTVTGLTTTVPGSILSLAGTSLVVVYANFDTWQSPVSTQSRLLTTISALGIIISWTCV